MDKIVAVAVAVAASAMMWAGLTCVVGRGLDRDKTVGVGCEDAFWYTGRDIRATKRRRASMFEEKLERLQIGPK